MHMRAIMTLVEAVHQETPAARFVRFVERWVKTSSRHGVEPPSMLEVGANRVVMEPLTVGHPEATNILLTIMGKAVDILGITLEVENVQDKRVYEANGFVPQGTAMVRSPVGVS